MLLSGEQCQCHKEKQIPFDNPADLPFKAVFMHPSGFRSEDYHLPEFTWVKCQ